MGVVPADDRADLVTHLPMVQRNKNTSEPFVLQRPDKPLDNRNAAVLAVRHGNRWTSRVEKSKRRSLRDRRFL